jgi:uncharacterized protein YkwD
MLFRNNARSSLLTMALLASPLACGVQESDEGVSRSAAAPGASAASCYHTDAFICMIELKITAGTNVKRAERSPLAYDREIAFVAREWSQAQAASHALSHDGFPAKREEAFHDEFAADAPLDARAENVAYTYVALNGETEADARRVADELVENWYNSSGHRTNMLGDYPRIGVGVHRQGSYFWATQLFGAR